MVSYVCAGEIDLRFCHISRFNCLLNYVAQHMKEFSKFHLPPTDINSIRCGVNPLTINNGMIVVLSYI